MDPMRVNSGIMVRKLDHCSGPIIVITLLSISLSVMESTRKIFREYLPGVLVASVDISISMRERDTSILLRCRVTLQASGEKGI